MKFNRHVSGLIHTSPLCSFQAKVHTLKLCVREVFPLYWSFPHKTPLFSAQSEQTSVQVFRELLFPLIQLYRAGFHRKRKERREGRCRYAPCWLSTRFFLCWFFPVLFILTLDVVAMAMVFNIMRLYYFSISKSELFHQINQCH